jgi:hypothetical protein
MNPYTTMEETDYPGWIRQETKTIFLSSAFVSLFVIVIIGIARPVKL